MDEKNAPIQPGETEWKPLNVKRAQELLAAKHGFSAGENDPVVLEVTLHQAVMADYEHLLRVEREKFALQCEATLEAGMRLLQDFAEANQGRVSMEPARPEARPSRSDIPQFTYFLMLLCAGLLFLLIMSMKGWL